MSVAGEMPALCEWAGGPEVFMALAHAIYAKIPADPMLGPLFPGMALQHAERVAHFIAEALGGEKLYTAGGGSRAAMTSLHPGRHITQVERKRWISLMQAIMPGP